MLDYFSNKYLSSFVVGTPNEPDQWQFRGFLSAYNVLTVGALQPGANGSYSQVSNATTSLNGTRSLVHIVAPGTKVVAADYLASGAQAAEADKTDGTSLATPFVTSAVALLAEYIGKNAATFPAQAKNPNLMKAVLLNSADKIKSALPALDGKQEMLRTVAGAETKQGATTIRRNWNQFDNVKDEYVAGNTPGAADTVRIRQETPLNPEFGAGALNVGRALVQLKGGQGGMLNPNVPAGTGGAIGWDTSTMVIAEGNPTKSVNNEQGVTPYLVRKYDNLVQFAPGSYLSATLAWTRPVTMTTKDAMDKTVVAEGPYQAGYKFTAGGKFDGNPAGFDDRPPDLNLYLMPKGATKLSDAVWASNSKDSSVEHFFFKLPTKDSKDHTGRSLYSATGYELWVTSKETTKSIPYGLAWWGERSKINLANPFSSISGTLFNDTDGNGLRGTTETGRAYVGVTLKDSNDVVIDRTTTDWDGTYQFDVADGMYQIEVSKPRDAAFTAKDYGSNTNDAIDSDVDVATGLTDTITVSGADVANIDAGLVAIPLGTVSGRAFNDANGDGLQGVGETGYVGVHVELATTDGEYAGSTGTDANGDYTFTNVAPGQYVLHYARPTNATLSPKDIGPDATDSDADPLTGLTDYFTLASGGAVVRDVGARAVGGSIAGVAYFDADEDGVLDSGEEGIPDQGVELRDALNAVIAYTTTASDGSYRFDELPPGSYSVTFAPEIYWQLTTSATQPRTVSAGTTATADAGLKFTSNTGMISGRVWVDSNSNGLQDSGEPARVGVTLELRAAGTSTVLGTAATDDTGGYWFSWIAPGTYDVKVVAPESGTLLNQGTDDTIDSDFDALSALASGVYVGAWGAVEHLDAGLLLPTSPPPPPPPPPPTEFATISGRAAFDTNQNGVRDAGEASVAGVIVQLLDTSGNVVASVPTDANGNYTLPNVPAGTYRLRFFAPPNATFAPKDVGINDTIDSDADALGFSDFFGLVPGQHAQDWDALFW